MVDLIKIYTSNYKLIFRIVYAYIGNAEDTKDILQDVFIRAYTAKRSDIPSEELLPWLIVIAKNRAKTFPKKKINNISLDENNIETPYESDFFKFTIYDAIKEMISIVPEDLREPLKMHFINNIPLKRISKKQGISYSRLRYWRKKFTTAIRPFLES